MHVLRTDNPVALEKLKILTLSYSAYHELKS